MAPSLPTIAGPGCIEHVPRFVHSCRSSSDHSRTGPLRSEVPSLAVTLPRWPMNRECAHFFNPTLPGGSFPRLSMTGRSRLGSTTVMANHRQPHEFFGEARLA